MFLANVFAQTAFLREACLTKCTLVSNLEMHRVEMSVQIRFPRERLATLFTSILDASMYLFDMTIEIVSVAESLRTQRATKRFQFEMHRLNVSIEVASTRKH